MTLELGDICVVRGHRIAVVRKRDVFGRAFASGAALSGRLEPVAVLVKPETADAETQAFDVSGAALALDEFAARYPGLLETFEPAHET